MIKRIATLFGIVGLVGLLCLVAALTSSCSRIRPVTPHELRHAYVGQSTQIDVVRAEVAATKAEVAAVKSELGNFKTETQGNFAVANENFQVLAVGVEQTKNRAEAAKNLGETTVKLLGPIGRDAGIASKEATAGRKAIEAAGQKIADAQKAIGEKIDTTAATTGAAVADVGRKVDNRADDVTEVVESIDRKVDNLDHEIKNQAQDTRDHTEQEVQRIRDDIGIHVNDLHEEHKKISDTVVEERKKALQDMKQLLNIP